MSNTLKTQPVCAAVVIAAGGAGTRMNAGVPKQFLEIAGKSVLLLTVESIVALEAVTQIVIALPPEHIERAADALTCRSLRILPELVIGGSNRQASVKNGCARVRPDADVILVHDAVRPLCPSEVMEQVLEAAWETGAAVPGLPATETIQRVSRIGRVLRTPPREELYAIQTPQAFNARLLRESLDRAEAEGFVGTDESSVVRWAGHPVTVIPGSPDNIKITRPLDMEIARLLFAQRNESKTCISPPNLRVGQGIDYHRLVEGRRLILGGVEIPFEKGLEGHSDADALLHAVCDALLGAAGLGDIGRHFPDTDSAYRGRDSLYFLREVRKKIEAAGWAASNIDATILLQRPKIAPYADKMRLNIAETLGIDAREVSVKATTTEGMNAEGRGEGASVQAVALIGRKRDYEFA
jgi:2-C-methyl-D-erythritol 4-phosphate cytidylyltransferase/2-C-methyl-D-erythritol 2,4-cyclodiphosphate synthase